MARLRKKEMEEEAQEQDGEVRVSSYIDDEGYVHETEVRVRMVRVETEEERRQRDEDEESENSLTTDYGSLEGHIEPVGDYEHLEDDACQAYRLEQIENDVGVEVYIIMKVRQFPGRRRHPYGIRDVQRAPKDADDHWSRDKKRGD